MTGCVQVPVEDRLHIEALRLLIENSKLRKCLNEYSSEFLNKTILKAELVADSAANERQVLLLMLPDALNPAHHDARADRPF
jgi:hypothetical protein